ncbi:hypothetical protein AKO1_007749 [Acrasis kona]|uniref:CWH43-like N-terminal domain-containing protein n=1 Tax=Acrasis kona TaxID=1008807 RepID=A0AAW2YQA1_9EUKA
MERQLQGHYLPGIISVSGLATVATCYALSVYGGHIELYSTTDITGTGKHSPSKYIFRTMMMSLSIIMIWAWYLCFCWIKFEIKRQEKQRERKFILHPIMMLVCGIIGSIGLLLTSMCITDVNFPLEFHLATAMIFFSCTVSAQIVCTRILYDLKMGGEGYQVVHWLSMRVKYATHAVSAFVLLCLIVFLLFSLPLWCYHVCEWTLLIALLCYNMTWCHDWKDKITTAVHVSNPMSVYEKYSLPTVMPDEHMEDI